MKELSDQEWTRRLKQDDPQASHLLWEWLFTRGIALAARFHQDEDLGRDAAVRAYLRIKQRGVHQFRFDCAFRGYCRVILVNEVRRLSKPAPATVELDEELVGEQDAPPRANPQGIWELLRPCLERLTRRERQVYDLCYVKSETPQDIASRLGISRNYVNVIAHRARLKLRQCLEERGFYSSADVLYCN